MKMLPKNLPPKISLLPEKDILNIALLPIEAEINQLFYQFTHPFVTKHSGYCLNPANALPHVTLSQFQHEEPEQAILAMNNYLGATVEVTLDRIYLSRYPVPGHLDAFWIGISTGRNDKLISMQTKICEAIKAVGRTPFTATGQRFHPHFTFLLLDPDSFTSTDLLLNLLSQMIGLPIECITRLGRSNQIGEFQEIIA